MESLEFMQVSASVGKGSVVAGGTDGSGKSNGTEDGRESKWSTLSEMARL